MVGKVEVDTEFNLKDEPYHGKCIVSPTRNQGRVGTCHLHTSCTCVESENKRLGALQKPQEDFEVILSDTHLLEQYPAEAEDEKHTGFTRLTKTLGVIEKHGVLGIKGEGPFKISSFEEKEHIHYVKPDRCRKAPNPPPKLPQGIKKLLHQGHVMAATFNISKNYRNLEPGDIYVYDALKPERSKKGRTCSHAVAVVGYGCRGGVWYYVFQNSYGEDWGKKGIGRVAMQSLTHLVQVKL